MVRSFITGFYSLNGNGNGHKADAKRPLSSVGGLTGREKEYLMHRASDPSLLDDDEVRAFWKEMLGTVISDKDPRPGTAPTIKTVIKMRKLMALAIKESLRKGIRRTQTQKA